MKTVRVVIAALSAAALVATAAGLGDARSASASESPPTVVRVKPAQGPWQGGTHVTITGTNFRGATAVSFGGTAATSFTVTRAKLISAVTPPHTGGVVEVTVTNGAGTSAPSAGSFFTYIPEVTGLSPSVGKVAGGQRVTVSGNGFAPGENTTTFNFATQEVATTSCSSTTTCTLNTPAHALGAVDVKATINGATSPKNAPADQFTYIPPPTVTAVSPTEGPVEGGNLVSLTGTGFIGVTEVFFGFFQGMSPSFTVNSETSITATVPRAEGLAEKTVSVSVVALGGASQTNGSYSYVRRPIIVYVNPSTGPEAGGTTVTITGNQGLTHATSVKFGATEAMSFNVKSEDSITAVSPPGTGTVNITVTNAGGTNEVSVWDQFTYR
jgi:hypothetical protein